MFLLNALTCQAALYRWTDQTGVIHFSDSLPPKEIPQEQLNLADPEQRPLLKKPLVVFQDNIFRVILISEKNDSMQFDVTYTEIHHNFPEIIRYKTRLILGSAGGGGATYLRYTAAPVEGGSATLKFTNGLSKRSPSKFETEYLYISLYYHDPEKKEDKPLYKKDIPYRKVWEKNVDGVYQ